MNQIRVCTKRINTRNFILQNTTRLYTNFGLGGGNGPFGPHWDCNSGMAWYKWSGTECPRIPGFTVVYPESRVRVLGRLVLLYAVLYCEFGFCEVRCDDVIP